MARLPYLDPDDAAEDVARALRRLPSLHVFSLPAHAETAFVPLLRLGSVILRELALDGGLRELAIPQVGWLAARYEWNSTSRSPAESGSAPGRSPHWTAASWSPAVGQRRNGRWPLPPRLPVSDGEIDDATYRAVREHLDEREVVELALTAGLYLMLAQIMAALRTDPDPPFGDLAALPPDLD